MYVSPCILCTHTQQQYILWNSTPTHPRLPPKNPHCYLKIHLYILTEVQYIRNRFQHVVHAAVTIWDYLFHGIPQEPAVFPRQIRVHMFGIISPSHCYTTYLLFSFWRHAARQFAIQYSRSTPKTDCIFIKKKLVDKQSIFHKISTLKSF